MPWPSQFKWKEHDPSKTAFLLEKTKRKLQASNLGRSMALIIRMLKGHFIFSILSAQVFWKLLIDLLIHEWVHAIFVIWSGPSILGWWASSIKVSMEQSRLDVWVESGTYVLSREFIWKPSYFLIIANQPLWFDFFPASFLGGVGVGDELIRFCG